MLRFSVANRKTKKLYKQPQLQKYLSGRRKVYSFDLLSGYYCPGAKHCKSRVITENGRHKIKDGPHCQFRCYSASQEVLYPSLYKLRKHNGECIRKLKTVKRIREQILKDLPANCGILRYHVGGDFFTQNYFRAAYEIAKTRPDILFYGYTKSIPFLLNLSSINLSKGIILPNFIITASWGGKWDNLIGNIRTNKVVYSVREANKLGLPVDKDDSHSSNPGGHFSIVIHGVQPKNRKNSK